MTAAPSVSPAGVPGPSAGTESEETLKETVAYHVFALADRAATTLPPGIGRRLFAAAAAAAFHLAPRARGIVQGNLSRVLGTPREAPMVRAAAREAFRSYARYWYDTFRARVTPPEEFLAGIRLEGRENLEWAKERGQGAVLALPHLGNWDAAGRGVLLSGFPITAVAELLRPPRLTELFRKHREALGMDIVVLGDSKRVGEELVRRIGNNGFVALVADRDLQGRGVEVEMFGAPRRLPAGPALLSLATGSPLMACPVYDLEDGWMIHINPPIEVDRSGELRRDVVALTEKLGAEFERAIAAAPTQWHMFQPAWEEDL